MTVRFLGSLAARLLCVPAFLLAAPAARADIDVWAAASLADVLDAAIARWEAAGGGPVRANYAATSLLARQIAEGAEADVFLSADGDWMKWLRDRGRVEGSPRPWAGNRLVLITPAMAPVLPPSLDAIPASLGPGQRLAVADIQHVPAGRYARAALEHFKIWDALAPRLAPFENVRAALQAVAGGSLPLGIVYATDALAEPAVRTVAVFPEGSHPPIVYWVARVKGVVDTDADAFLEWLLAGSDRKPLLEEHGFTEVPEGAAL